MTLDEQMQKAYEQMWAMIRKANRDIGRFRTWGWSGNAEGAVAECPWCRHRYHSSLGNVGPFPPERCEFCGWVPERGECGE